MHAMDGESHEDRAVLLRVEDEVATVSLNRPERRNAVSWQLVNGLVRALRDVEGRPDVRLVVVTGIGDFSVGADLARVGSDRARDQETRTLRGRSVEDDRERLAQASTVAQLLFDLPQPTIAKINGACAGAGLSIALAADFRIASPTAVFNTAFLGAGVSGDLGSAWLLTRVVGSARARSLLLDPRKMSAEEALAVGIVTEVASDLDARVEQLSSKLVSQSPLAMAHAKQNLRDAVVHDFATYLRAEVVRMVESARSADAKKAAQAFIAGRRAGRDG